MKEMADGAMNAEVMAWSVFVTTKMQQQASGMGFSRRIRPQFKLRYGDIDRISWKIPRYSIMVEKGVGRGVGMKAGVRFDKSKDGQAIFRRKAIPWFSSAISGEISNLADIMAKHEANVVVRGLK